jgi:CRP/FNR family cyclic AMP-dependent transcriptional regulator
VNDVISIVDADADLADLLDETEVQSARRKALTRVRRLSPGAWDAKGAIERDHHHRGFLVIDGLLSREVDVLGRRAVELLGPGDVLRPWHWDEDGSHVHAEAGWIVLEPTELAVLDHGFVKRMAPWPQLGVELFARGTRRAHHLAVVLAIAHQRLADLVGAHRPSVTTAMGDLTRTGSISRRDDGAWVLHGTPPEKLRHHPLGAALT